MSVGLIITIFIILFLFFQIARLFSPKRTNLLQSWGIQPDFPISKQDKAYFDELKLKKDSFFSLCQNSILKFYLQAVKKVEEVSERSTTIEERIHILTFSIALVKEVYLVESISPKKQDQFNVLLPEKEQSIIKALADQIDLLDEEKDKKLYALSTTRWKRTFQQMKEKTTTAPGVFYQKTLYIASLHQAKSPKRNIYYEAFRYLTDSDRTLALKAYLLYFETTLGSSIQPKPIGVKAKKKLFPLPAQEKAFQKLQDKIRQGKKTEPLVDSVTDFYKENRRAIKLNASAIEQASREHGKVIAILNPYLSEEEPEKVVSEPMPEKKENTGGLSHNQKMLISLFVENENKLHIKEIDTFALAKGLFPLQLLDSINDYFYEQLDDLLIEQDDPYYLLNHSYYQLIMHECKY